MKTLSKAVLAAIGISLAAAAAAGPGGGYGMGMGPGGGKGAACARAGGADVGTRLETLKSELKLTPQQTGAWDAFEKAVRTQWETKAQARGQFRSIEDPNERMDAHIQFMEQRVEGMKAVAAARKELYDTLTPEQKEAADRFWQHGGRGMGPRV